MDKKRKYYNKKIRKNICLKISPEEESILEKMMSSEEWTNQAGFIREKIFGEHIDAKFEKMTSSGNEEDIKIIIKHQLERFNKRLDYINYKYDEETEAYKNKTEGLDQKEAARWFAYLYEWKKEIISNERALYYLLSKLLQSLKIDFERHTYEKVETLPEHTMEKISKDWNDTLSPEALHISKIKVEEFQKDFEQKMKDFHDNNK